MGPVLKHFKVSKYDQSCGQNLYEYTNFHGILSSKLSTYKYV